VTTACFIGATAHHCQYAASHLQLRTLLQADVTGCERIVIEETQGCYAFSTKDIHVGAARTKSPPLHSDFDIPHRVCHPAFLLTMI
jgi:hypothetical protein